MHWKGNFSTRTVSYQRQYCSYILYCCWTTHRTRCLGYSLSELNIECNPLYLDVHSFSRFQRRVFPTNANTYNTCSTSEEPIGLCAWGIQSFNTENRVQPVVYLDVKCFQPTPVLLYAVLNRSLRTRSPLYILYYWEYSAPPSSHAQGTVGSRLYTHRTSSKGIVHVVYKRLWFQVRVYVKQEFN